MNTQEPSPQYKNSKNHYTLVSADFKIEGDALVDAAKKAIKRYKDKAQAVHILFVNLIQFQGKWKAVVSVIVMDDIDGDGKRAITFGHLPAKYSAHYDDLLPEVDHLNVIDDVSIWRDIKKFLLDLHFYQAVHFGKILRIEETGGGYFTQRKEKLKIDAGLIPDFEKSSQDKEADIAIQEDHYEFQEEATTLQVLSQREEYDIILRNQREGISMKNLIVKFTT